MGMNWVYRIYSRENLEVVQGKRKVNAASRVNDSKWCHFELDGVEAMVCKICGRCAFIYTLII